MGSPRAVAGTLLFLVVAPGVIAGVIPWALTGWQSGDAFGSLGLVRVVGAVVLVAGIAALLEAFARFAPRARDARTGRTRPGRLVVGGLYRLSATPCTSRSGAPIVGQALVLGGRCCWLCRRVRRRLAAFVRWYEEPTLAAVRRPYRAYRRAVPGWLPRRTPWEGGGP